MAAGMDERQEARKRQFPLVSAVEALTAEGFRVLSTSEAAEYDSLLSRLTAAEEALRQIVALDTGYGWLGEASETIQIARAALSSPREGQGPGDTGGRV